MVEEKRASTKKGKGGAMQVIVEMRVQRDRGMGFALQMAGGLEVAGFQLDTEYEPVAISSATERSELAADLEATREEVVLVRGTIEEKDVENLKKQPNVIDVWPDTKIAPFDAGDVSDNVTLASKEAFGTCPIPPCDCDPGTAKGAIPDVAKYLGVDKIWAAGYKGKGCVIGVVDGGITAKGRVTDGKIPQVIGGWPSDWGTKDLWDGHGNMCATDSLGMAPEARIYDFRIDSGTMSGLISNAIAAYNWAIQQHKKDGTPQVMTNSWGIYQKSWDPKYATDPNHPFTKKVVEAINEGILVLFAAGNCGEACPSSRCGSDAGPGKSIWGANGHPMVMTVGAANTKGQLIGYSSQGPAALDEYKPDFCSISHFKGYFNSDTGTSAACPIAAGVVALLKQYKPSYTQSMIKQDLKNSANNIGPDGWDKHSGSGIIQPYKIVVSDEGETKLCEKYKEQAAKYLDSYKETNNKKYLCYYYRYIALYYRCLYQSTKEKKYLCYFYRYIALYYNCLYQTTRDKKHLCYYYRYMALYYNCLYQTTGNKKYLCYYYRYMALYYSCMYQTTRDQKYLNLYQQYTATYNRCKQQYL